MKEDNKEFQRDTRIQYPIKEKTFMKGPSDNQKFLHKKFHNIYTYNPIYSVPENESKGIWTFECQDSEYSLYDKVYKMCGLDLYNKHLLYVNFESLLTPNYNQIVSIQKTNLKYGKQISLEEARCIFISDFIRSETIKSYKNNEYIYIYSYTFRYYIPKDQWEYFYMAPILIPLFENIVTEIHTRFNLFRSMIVFGLDNNNLPYMEVLIVNKPKVNSKARLSKYNTSIDYSTGKPKQPMIEIIEKLNDCFVYGLNRGIDQIFVHLDKGTFRPISDPEEFRKLARPSIKDLNFECINLQNYIQ